MAYDPNPYLQRVGHYDANESIPGQPAPDIPVDNNSGSGGSMPTLKRQLSGQASPDVNPQPLGTRIGMGLRDAAKGVANLTTGVINQGMAQGADLANAATYLPRVIGGGARDVVNAVTGMAPSQNEGQPIGGLTAPQLKRPYQAPVVSFSATNPNVPVRNPDFSAVQGSAVTTAAAPGAASADPLTPPSASLVSPANSAAAAAAPQLTKPGVNIDGRSLAVGAMVNGVPTFSDGTGGIPRTMDDATIKNYGNTLSRADPGALGHVLASDALGYTPSTDQMVGQNVAQLQRSQPVTGSRPTAQQFADADRIAIASRDPRSAAGIAARNLSVDAQYGGTPQLRRMAEQSLAQLTSGTDQGGTSAQQAENQQALVAEQGGNELANTALAGKNALANTGLEIQRAQLTRERQPVVLDGGILATRDPITGVVTPSTMADGTPAKTLVSKEDAPQKRTNEIMDQLSKTAAELSKTAMPPPNAPAGWTPDSSQLREQAAKLHGLQLGTDPKTGKRYAMVNGQAVAL
jgi:hypothetical protein